MDLTSIIKWISLCFTLAGAFSTSFGIEPINIYFLNIGAFGYLIWSYRVKDTNLMIVNAGLLLIYLAGLIYHAL